MATLGRPQQFVELDLDGLAITILRILNQEYHQEGHNRRRGVDDQLPGITEVKYRTQNRPNDDGAKSQSERHWATHHAGGDSSEVLESTMLFSRSALRVF